MAHPLQQPQHDIIFYVHTYNGGGSSGSQIKCTHAQRGPCALSPVLGRWWWWCCCTNGGGRNAGRATDLDSGVVVVGTGSCRSAGPRQWPCFAPSSDVGENNWKFQWMAHMLTIWKPRPQTMRRLVEVCRGQS